MEWFGFFLFVCFSPKFSQSHLAWWPVPVPQTLRRLKQEDHEFETSLGHIARLHLKMKRHRQMAGQLWSLTAMTEALDSIYSLPRKEGREGLTLALAPP